MKLKSILRHSEWFDIHNGDGARVCIQEVTDDDTARLTLGQVMTIETFGSSGFDAATVAAERKLSFAIVEWEKIEDEDGEPLPLTEANKQKLIAQEGLRYFLNGCHRKVNEAAQKQREEAAKN